MAAVKAYGDNPLVSFLAGGKEARRLLRPTFPLMASAWNASIMPDGNFVVRLDRELYTSVHAFERVAIQTFQDAQGGRLAGLQSSGIPHCAPWLVWDIDDKESPVRAVKSAEKLVRHLILTFGLDDQDDVIRINISGSKGVHVRLWNPEFDPVDIQFSTDTHRRHKSFAMTLAAEAGVVCDESIYSVGNLIRVPNSRHPKTQRHAVPVPIDSLLNHDPEAVIDPAETLWQSCNEPLRTARFLWPTGLFKESFREAFAVRWAAAGQVAEQAVEKIEVRKASFKTDSDNHKLFRLPFATQEVLLKGVLIVGGGDELWKGSRACAAWEIGKQCGERGYSLKGAWGLFADAILGSGLPYGEAASQFQDGWRKNQSSLFPGAKDETLT